MVHVYNLEYIIENEYNLELKISDQLFLETLLMEIRRRTISYSSFKKKQKGIREQELEEEISKLEETENIDIEKISDKKNELENLRKEKIQGLMVRAKIKWAEEGEKPTHYFCSLESRNYIYKTVMKLSKDDDNIINNQQEILDEVKNFYSDLYKVRERNQDTKYQEILNDLDHPVLTQIKNLALKMKLLKMK